MVKREGVIVFNATFNNISVISWGQLYWWRRPEYRMKTPTCRLNGGGQQFYKYQQNEQPPLTSNN